MPFVRNGDAKIYYEVSGAGFPVLLLSANFMRSTIGVWALAQQKFPDFRFNPLTDFTSDFTMTAMDQRNAMGQSVGPITPSDGWHTFAEDQIAVADAAGFDRFHVMGGCIGVTFAFELCKRIPDRIVSLVLQDPIGVSPRAPMASVTLFDEYAAEITAARPDLDIADVKAFGRNLYAKDFDKEFTFNATREFVRELQTPMLIMPGSDDDYHPHVTSAEIHANAPNSEIDWDWRQRPAKRNGDRVRDFLKEHTPTAQASRK